MKQILIGKTGLAYAAKTGGGVISGVKEIGLLDTGALAIFTAAGVLVTTGNMSTTLDDQKSVYIAVGNQVADSKSYITSMIPRNSGTSFDIQSYVTPVKQRKFLGYDGTTAGTAMNLPSLVAGDEAFIKIIDTTPGLRTIGAVDAQEVFRYSTVVIAGDTATTLITRLVTAINDTLNQTGIVTATLIGAGTGIQLDAIAYGTTFKIARDGILVGATIVEAEGTTAGIAVAVNYGKGTDTQILALEDTYSVERGNTNQIFIPQTFYTKNSLVTSGAKYDTYTIAWNGSRTISTGRQDTSRFEIVVAIPNAATQQAAWQTIIQEVFAGTIAGTPIETGS